MAQKRNWNSGKPFQAQAKPFVPDKLFARNLGYGKQRCLECGFDVPVLATGEIQAHRIGKKRIESYICAGSPEYRKAK